MSTGGWIMIVFSWALIIALTVFCYARIATMRRDNIKAPLEISTETDQT